MPPRNRKLIIVGWNNEKSWLPEDDLEPYTKNGAGERLYAMVNDVTQLTKEEYMKRVELINFRRVGPGETKERICRRPAVILGVETWYSLRYPQAAMWTSSRGAWLVPHPSGKNRIYNSEVARLNTGRLIARLAGLS
jgi:hypothetical protein